MADFSTCGGCQYLQSLTYGLACIAPFECGRKNGTGLRYVTHTGYKPAGYRTPEDRLDVIERRLDRLERDYARRRDSDYQ